MSNQLISDKDLRQALQDHGVEVGPITTTTRTVYKKKLEKIVSSHESLSTKGVESFHEEVSFQTVSRTVKDDYGPVKNITSTPQTAVKSKDFDSQYQYARHESPLDENLRRRPLYTPGGTLRSVPVTKVKKSESSQVKQSSLSKAKPGFPWCRLVSVLLVLAILVALIIYYHMESNINNKLPVQ